MAFGGVRKVSAQVVDSTGTGYCAWGCFRCLGVPGEGTFSSPPRYLAMTEDTSFRRKPLTPEQRQARDATRRVEAEKAMRDHEVAQKAFYENRERLRAERLAREAAAAKA